MAERDSLWGLIYSSTATRPMTAEDLEALLAEARARNEALGITGWLTYASGEEGEGGTFTQYIEGPRSALRQLFYGEGKGGGIVHDPRHTEVRVLQEGRFGEGPPGCRLYPAWRMEWVTEPQPV